MYLPTSAFAFERLKKQRYRKNSSKEHDASGDEDGKLDDDLLWDDMTVNGSDSPISGSFVPPAGAPFSALTPSIWPQDILARIQQTEDAGVSPGGEYDEFGFSIESDSVDDKSPRPGRFVTDEDQSLRLKWTAHLEFTQNQELGELTWDKVSSTFPRTDKLRELVHAGVPHSLRAPIWMRTSGALHKKQTMDFSYKQIVKASGSDGNTAIVKQIEKDLLRTLPSNACFSTPSSTGTRRLRRILKGLSWLYPDVGYCQGMGVIVATLLLFIEEEDTFWLMCTIIEDLVPPSYYSSTLLGVQADQRVLRQLIVSYLPKLDESLKEHDIELSLITLHWFLTLFASVVDMKVLLRIWDQFFYEGSVVLFRITLGMIKMKENLITSQDNSAQIFNALSDIPGEIIDANELFDQASKASGSLTDIILEAHRKKHLAFLMADLESLTGFDAPRSGDKQKIHRRPVRSESSSWLDYLMGRQELALAKAKNIRQTEILADLREAILQTARHFDAFDPKKVDYSVESHGKDHENFVNVAKNRRRRAKALLDFERHDDDELGFRKNDIITIISQKDEHCWVGELNGLRGWFPAKFVEILDERSKEYSSAGDDSVSETVTDLVRGSLCPALKSIFEHGMKRQSFLGGSYHPWHFIEEASGHQVEKDFQSVYSRLVLCKTFRLDEDGKVLSPEEILYRAVQSINMTHDNAKTQMDVKLRSLICYGLNEQCLHLWFESFCSSEDIVSKWFHPWSFIRSPGWVQIKCELRVLASFAFSLNIDWEILDKKGDVSKPLKDSVQDMLVKHHLFSWDL